MRTASKYIRAIIKRNRISRKKKLKFPPPSKFLLKSRSVSKILEVHCVPDPYYPWVVNFYDGSRLYIYNPTDSIPFVTHYIKNVRHDNYVELGIVKQVLP